MKIDGTFPKKFICGALENTSGDMRMLSDLQLVYMVPRNSTQLLNINTTKFQMERDRASLIYCMEYQIIC